METIAFTSHSKFDDHPAWVPRVPRKRALTELIVVLMMMWAVFLLVGCTKKTETSYTDSSTAAHTDTNYSATNAPASTPPPAAAPAPATMTDANVVAMLSEADSSEIASAKLVLAKSKNADVKSFAKMMIAEHNKMKADKATLAKKMNMTPAPPANDPMPAAMTQSMSDLNSASTPQAMDSVYISQAVADHEKDLQEVRDLQITVQAPELKEALKKAEPVIQKHLDHAKMVQEKLSKK